MRNENEKKGHMNPSIFIILKDKVEQTFFSKELSIIRQSLIGKR
jgi:hypothetical protein